LGGDAHGGSCLRFGARASRPDSESIWIIFVIIVEEWHGIVKWAGRRFRIVRLRPDEPFEIAPVRAEVTAYGRAEHIKANPTIAPTGYVYRLSARLDLRRRKSHDSL